MLLAHISDLHVLDLTGVRPWRFLNKRLTGGLNLLLGRHRMHRVEVIEAALETINELGCDHVAVTGDITNLALEPEFARARAILEAFVPTAKLSVVPGNHDRYTLGAAVTKRFEAYFHEMMRTDLPQLPSNDGWPYVKLVGDIALIGLSSAVAQPWLVSGGRVGSQQLEALEAVLRHADVRARYTVVLMHHHLFRPDNKKHEFPRGLFDRAAVIDTLTGGGVDLLLHGHNHFYGVTQVPRTNNGGGSMIVAEAGSTSVVAPNKGDDRRAGKFNVYQIEDGRLRAINTYLYKEGKGFGHWKRWDFDAGVNVPVVNV